MSNLGTPAAPSLAGRRSVAIDDDFRPGRHLSAAMVQSAAASLTWWTRGPWLARSTVLGGLISERRRVPIPGLGRAGSGHLHLHVTMRSVRAPAVLLVHGIGGSADSPYILRAAAAFLAEGFHVARLDLRGAGDSVVDAPSLYNAGLSSDVALAGAALAADPNVDGVGYVGFSLGGNMVLKLAGEWGASPPEHARGVVAISPVVDLEPVARALEVPRRLPYRMYIVRHLLLAARAFMTMHPDRARDLHMSLEGLSRWSTVRDYDRKVVVPMYGYASPEAYYAAARSASYLGDIGIRTLFAFAEDDPIIPASTVEPWLSHASPAVELAWTRQGGHVGWIEGVSKEAFVRTWPVVRAIRFLRG